MTATDPPAPPGAVATDRRRTIREIVIVLGLSLGASAVYAVISIVAKLTAGPSLAHQQTVLIAPTSPRPYVDLADQLADVVFTLVPVALVLFLLARPDPVTGPERDTGPEREAGGDRGARHELGLDLRRPGRDLGVGAVLAAVIGLPGLALYVVGRRLGITVQVVPSALTTYWWTLPLLVLQAVKNALIEEVVVVGYLLTRLRELRTPPRLALALSATLRGSYHLYQGFGPFLGNAVMGLVFGEWFRRRGRVMPLVIAHSLLDIVAFVGYQLIGNVSWLR